MDRSARSAPMNRPSLSQDTAYTPRRSSVDHRDSTHAIIIDPHSPQLPQPTTQTQRGNRKRSRWKPNYSSERHSESGRTGIHPIKFVRIVFKSSGRASTVCSLLWPVVPAALAVRYALPDQHMLIFILAYIAMIPCANLVGFASREFCRKLPHVVGVLAEITFGSVVEIILFAILLYKDYFYVAKAAMLGSILATMLLCLGACFFVGGIRDGHEHQTFSDAVSETGSGLLLTAGVALAVPTIFSSGLGKYNLEPDILRTKTLKISRTLSVLLIVAYVVYVFFQVHTHHSLYQEIYEHDEKRDSEQEPGKHPKERLTMTECVVSLIVSIGLVTAIAVILVLQIHYVIEVTTLSDPFMGLILVPLVEKFAEHLTAIDEAWDNQMNFAMSHVLGATLQTALFNGPLTVVIGWAFGKGMDLNFDIFNLVMLILSILTVGRFLQDQKTNYLEGFLLVALYVAIGVSAYYYPNPKDLTDEWWKET